MNNRTVVDGNGGISVDDRERFEQVAANQGRTGMSDQRGFWGFCLVFCVLSLATPVAPLGVGCGVGLLILLLCSGPVERAEKKMVANIESGGNGCGWLLVAMLLAIAVATLALIAGEMAAGGG